MEINVSIPTVHCQFFVHCVDMLLQVCHVGKFNSKFAAVSVDWIEEVVFVLPCSHHQVL